MPASSLSAETGEAFSPHFSPPHNANFEQDASGAVINPG
jgi:hypothetical protein